MGRTSVVIFTYLLFAAQVGWAGDPIAPPVNVNQSPVPKTDFVPAPQVSPYTPTQANGGIQSEALDVAVSPPKPLTPIKAPTDPDTSEFFQEYPSAWSKYSSSKEWCYSQYSLTGKMCLSNSPALSQMADVATMMAPAAGGMTDQCSSLGKAMKAVSTILTGYTAVCTAHVGMCGSKCGEAARSLDAVDTANSGLSAAKTACSAACDPRYQVPTLCPPKVGVDGAACAAAEASSEKCQKSCLAEYTAQSTHYTTSATPEKQPQTVSSLADLTAQCKKRFMEKVASAGMGIVSSLATMSRANKCEEKSSVDGKVSDSNKKEAASMVRPDGSGSMISTSGGTLGTDNLGNNNPKLGDIGGGAGGPGLGESGKAADGGVGGGAGGGGGMNGGLSAGSDGKSGNGYGASGYNTKIYGGDAGGGGGGSRGGSSGSGYSAYLPGGKKDPNAGSARNPASFGISSASGKSNWEKVHERYSDQRSSLISGGF